MAGRVTPNHVLHLLLSICTLGSWLVVWIGLTLLRLGPFRCPKYRSATVPSVPGFEPAEYRPAFSLRAMAPWLPLARS